MPFLPETLGSDFGHAYFRYRTGDPRRTTNPLDSLSSFYEYGWLDRAAGKWGVVGPLSREEAERIAGRVDEGILRVLNGQGRIGDLLGHDTVDDLEAA